MKLLRLSIWSLLVVIMIDSKQLFSQTELRFNSQVSQVDVFIRDQAFTSYLFGKERSKPVLFPVRAPGGRIANRNFPFKKDVPGEYLDHPHQESVFFAFGDVCDERLDFWSGHDGVRIVHRSVLEMKSGETGLLRVLLDWVDSEGKLVSISDAQDVLEFHYNSNKISQIKKPQ